MTQQGAMAASEAHTLALPGSNPGSATKPMRLRPYMYFAAKHRVDFDLTMFGIIRRWCLIGKFSSEPAPYMDVAPDAVLKDGGPYLLQRLKESLNA